LRPHGERCSLGLRIGALVHGKTLCGMGVASIRLRTRKRITHRQMACRAGTVGLIEDA
jgi:hypothetical protein